MTRAEHAILRADFDEFEKYYSEKPEDAKALISVGDSELAAKFDAGRLAAWTLVCNQVMNLDEALNK